MMEWKLDQLKYANQLALNNAIADFVRGVKPGSGLSDRQKEWIKRYSGDGGLAKFGASGKGVLYEFYTNDWISSIMYRLAVKHGYKGGPVLEPSVGTGRLLQDLPDGTYVRAFEINPVSAAITTILHGDRLKLNLHVGEFEKYWLESPRFNAMSRNKHNWDEREHSKPDRYPFKLVIGNPPYGIHKNRYTPLFTKADGYLGALELFFLYKGVHLLADDGILVYVISSNVMRNGSKEYEAQKKPLFDIAEIVDSFHLPPVFDWSDVPVTFLVLKKRKK